MHASVMQARLPAQLNIRFNSLGDKGNVAIQRAVRGKEGFDLLS